MNKKFSLTAWWVIIFGLEILAIGFLCGTLSMSDRYKRGQIDAMNGKWKYEMIIKADTTYQETEIPK